MQVSQATRETATILRRQGLTAKQIAKQMNMSVSAIYAALPKDMKAPRTPREKTAESESSRERILSILSDGPIGNDGLLMNAMGQSWRTLGIHSLDHQLFSMEKAGLIEMDVKRNGSVQRITNIRLPKQSRVSVRVEASEPIPMVNPYHPQRAESLPGGVLPIDIQPVKPEAFPILDSLRQRAQERDATNRRADAYLVAASALDGVAQEESDRLMALANDLADGVAMSPVEAEYLRYAATKEETGE